MYTVARAEEFLSDLYGLLPGTWSQLQDSRPLRDGSRRTLGQDSFSVNLGLAREGYASMLFGVVSH